MEKEISNVTILDELSGQILYQTSLDNLDYAYQYAAELEEMGLQIKITAPTLTESLLNSLGANEGEKTTYLRSLEEELDSHEEPPCSSCL